MIISRKFYTVLTAVYTEQDLVTAPELWETYDLEQAKEIADDPTDRIFEVTRTTAITEVPR